jgi:hypothetical protein
MRTHFILLSASLAVSMTLSTAATGQQAEGAFRGMFVCEKSPVGADILRVPVDVHIKAGNAIFARPLLNPNGQRVLGSELGTGTLDADGTLRLTSSWHMRGVTVKGEYSGKLTPTGGALTGTQSWQGGSDGAGSRTCTAAIVPAPQGRRAAADEKR